MEIEASRKKAVDEGVKDEAAALERNLQLAKVKERIAIISKDVEDEKKETPGFYLFVFGVVFVCCSCGRQQYLATI